MSVVVDISVSLDGYVAGPGAGPEAGLGVGGEGLHTWVFSDDPDDARVLAASTEGTGAVLMGRRTFDICDAVWDDEVGYGGRHAAEPPCFVVTHTVPGTVRLADRFTFVTDGPAAAVAAAQEAAGDADVVVMGGGDLCRQVLAAGLADELRLHLAPIVLGGGAALWPDSPLTPVATVATPHATHLTYRVR